MSVSADGDVHPTAKRPHQSLGSPGVRLGLDVLEVMSHADPQALGLDDHPVGDPRVLRHARATVVRHAAIAVAATDHRRRNPFEAIDDGQGVEVTTVQYAIAAAQGLSDDVRELRSGLGHVSVRNQSDAHATSVRPSADDDIRRPAVLVHTSDCHLHANDNGIEQRAFSAVIDLCEQVRADALLIAGDLFDHNRVGEDLVRWVIGELARCICPVVLLVGNHDCYNEASVYRRFDIARGAPNVVVIDEPDGMTVHVPGSDLQIWGRAMPEHTPDYHPLAGVPGPQAGKWSVVAAHGLVDAAAGRSSPIGRKELDAISADYVALGHIHVHTVVQTSPLTVYCGATAHPGRAGCVVVSFVPHQSPRADWTPLP